jgi:choline dehydrogenase-like flavoprotein
MTFIDARSLPPGHHIEADLCIVGAGAAGLAIARSFMGGSKRVALLESGGIKPDPETQALYAGENVGAPHAPLAQCRLRYFGGTTNHWTAHVRPLDPLDFQARPWVPHSGWPFGRVELDPYYERARELLGLPERPFEVAAWAGKRARPWPFGADRVRNAVRQIVAEAQRRLGPRLREEFSGSQNVDTYLFANLLRIELSESRRRVTKLHVGTLEGGRFTLSARRIVLATGGIENARLLLLSGIGADGLVGRFYANHPSSNTGRIQLTRGGLDARFYLGRAHARGVAAGFFSLSPELQRAEELRNCWVQVYRRARGPVSPAQRAFARLATDVDRLGGPLRRGGREPGVSFGMQAIVEPAPNPDSRVRLGDERDALGQRRVILDWRVSETESRTVRRTFELVARELGASGLGRAHIAFPEGAFARLDATASHHHMGSTRMHVDPARGVVDADCRMHGIENLFVAGSSVFPTYGTANPTYTLLALAFRLADHLKGLPA